MATNISTAAANQTRVGKLGTIADYALRGGRAHYITKLERPRCECGGFIYRSNCTCEVCGRVTIVEPPEEHAG